MAKYKVVSISKNGFAFCRYTVALLIWSSLIFQIKELMIIVFIILASSAILTVKRAPLVWLYTVTIDKLFPSKREIVNEKGMRFAHTLGTTLAAIAILFLFFINEKVGWGVVFLFAVLKSFSALGYCSGLKLYNCLNNGQCCRFKGQEKNKNA